MTIILPDPGSQYVWVKPPAWIYAQWHWAWVMVAGLILIVIGVSVRRLDHKSFPATILCFLGLAPFLIGGFVGLAAWQFSKQPTPYPNHRTWSAQQNPINTFKVKFSVAQDQGYEAPERTKEQDAVSLNRNLGKKFHLTPLHPQQTPNLTSVAETDDVAQNNARKATPFLFNNQLYTCTFIVSDQATEPNLKLTRITISKATCADSQSNIIDLNIN